MSLTPVPVPLLLDPTQPLAQAETTRLLLEAVGAAGPEATAVRMRGWTWGSTTVICITADN